MNPALKLMDRYQEAADLLQRSIPGATDDQVKAFLYDVMQELQRHPDQVAWLESKLSDADAYKQGEAFINHLGKALEALQSMDSGSVIRQHMHMNGEALAVDSIEETLQAIIRATHTHMHYDLNTTSKLKPANRRHMPLLFHVGQEWVKHFPGEPVSESAKSAFFRFTNFLIYDAIGDRHHNNGSLIKIAKNEGLLP